MSFCENCTSFYFAPGVFCFMNVLFIAFIFSLCAAKSLNWKKNCAWSVTTWNLWKSAKKKRCNAKNRTKTKFVHRQLDSRRFCLSFFSVFLFFYSCFLPLVLKTSANLRFKATFISSEPAASCLHGRLLECYNVYAKIWLIYFSVIF